MQYTFDWQGNAIKLNVYHEARKDSRVSISKTGVNIRLPILLPEFEKQRLITKFIDWAKVQLDEKPHFHYDKYKKYSSGDQIALYDATYEVNLLKSNTDKSTLFIKDNKFAVYMAIEEEEEAYYPTVSKLIYRMIAKLYKEKIWQWLQNLNQEFNFGELKSSRMKNNSTNWGSCSNKGNINISVRLLLAPKEVVEYVLIHELAHLQQQNHGPKFWALVAKACPDYKRHEKWLKVNAKSCII